MTDRRTTWLDDVSPLDWSRLEDAGRIGKDLLMRLSADRSTLRWLTFMGPHHADADAGAGADAGLGQADGSAGYLLLYSDAPRHLHVGLQVATADHPGGDATLPSPAVCRVLTGAHPHAWLDQEGRACFVTTEQAPSSYVVAGGLRHRLGWTADSVALVLTPAARAPFLSPDCEDLSRARREALRDRADLLSVL